MKKIIFIAAALALCSCTKELADNGPFTEGNGTAVTFESTPPEPAVKSVPDGLYLYPNPVVSVMKVRIGGEAKAVIADMQIIDAGGRMMTIDKVTLDDNGIGQKDMSYLAPGFYTVIVESNGKRYIENVVKR